MKPALVYSILAISGALVASPSYSSEELAQKNNCLACHAVAGKVVGPAYQDVAKKYKDKGQKGCRGDRDHQHQQGWKR